MRKKFFLLIIVCLVMGAGVMAQTSTVSGTVFAEDNNEPIIGASVLVKGTTLGAVTDIEGKFTILNVPGTAKTVIVSFVGMQKVEAAIKPAMKVVLKSDSELLDEVMVVAYGTDRSVHSRRVTATCKYTDGFYLFLCHDSFLHLQASFHRLHNNRKPCYLFYTYSLYSVKHF